MRYPCSPRPAMDVLYNACNEVSRTNDRPMALTVVGDFCQLPPIADPGTPETGRYAFEADCWRPNFSENTTRLTRIWRQDDAEFLQALHAARRGVGERRWRISKEREYVLNLV